MLNRIKLFFAFILAFFEKKVLEDKTMLELKTLVINMYTAYTSNGGKFKLKFDKYLKEYEKAYAFATDDQITGDDAQAAELRAHYEKYMHSRNYKLVAETLHMIHLIYCKHNRISYDSPEFFAFVRAIIKQYNDRTKLVGKNESEPAVANTSGKI